MLLDYILAEAIAFSFHLVKVSTHPEPEGRRGEAREAREGEPDADCCSLGGTSPDRGLAFEDRSQPAFKHLSNTIQLVLADNLPSRCAIIFAIRVASFMCGGIGARKCQFPLL